MQANAASEEQVIPGDARRRVRPGRRVRPLDGLLRRPKVNVLGGLPLRQRARPELLGRAVCGAGVDIDLDHPSLVEAHRRPLSMNVAAGTPPRAHADGAVRAPPHVERLRLGHPELHPGDRCAGDDQRPPRVRQLGRRRTGADDAAHDQRGEDGSADTCRDAHHVTSNGPELRHRLSVSREAYAAARSLRRKSSNAASAGSGPRRPTPIRNRSSGTGASSDK